MSEADGVEMIFTHGRIDHPELEVVEYEMKEER
jgi:hypothetical protein